MILHAPPSRAIRHLTPSLLEPLATCRMRVSFMQSGNFGAPRSPAIRLGDACHHVMDYLVSTRCLLGDQWDVDLQRKWREEIDRERAVQTSDDQVRWGQPEAWPNYELKRARLRNLARSVRQLMLDLPSEAHLLTEHELSGRGGLLVGRADLVVRSAECHIIVDYKSGSVVDAVTLAMIPAYENQLRIYAALEREESGEWPQKAVLMPLNGPPIELVINPIQCDALADEAVARLDAYNLAVPGPQPATPSPDACRRCAASCHCPEFWTAYGPAWTTDLIALRGEVADVSLTSLGGITIRVQVEVGAGGPVAEVHRLREADHPGVSALRIGDTFSAVGLHDGVDGSALYLPSTGQFARN